MDILDELERAGGAYLDRHFVYVSGQHGPHYINLDPVFPNVELISAFCDLMVEPFLGEVDTVAAPATGGIVLAVLTAKAFAIQGQTVASVWADKNNGQFVFERAGFRQHLDTRRVLVVEDVLNTGTSVEKVCRAAEASGAKLVGASIICNRGNVSAEQLGVPRLEALATVSFVSVDPPDCKLCTAGVPIVDDIGHGADFRAEHFDYSGGFVSLLDS